MIVLYPDLSKIIGFNYKSEKKPYYTLVSVCFIVIEKGKMLKSIIDKDFYSDGCSDKLKIFWLFIGCPHNPKQMPACLIHDWIVEHPEVVGYDRRLSSKIFETVLLKEGVNPLLAKLMFYCVEIWQEIINYKTKRWK